MVKGLFFLLLIASALWASESGSLAHGAFTRFQQGRYPEAYAQFQQALDASRKEANLGAESRIHMALATLATHAEDYRSAGEHLGQVRTKALDRPGRAAYLLAGMEFHNSQDQFTQTLSLWQTFRAQEKWTRLSKPTQARLYCEAARAAAANGQSADAQEWLNEAARLYAGDAPGLLVFAQARVADALGRPDAAELYLQALEYAVSQERFYTAGSILLRLGELARMRADTGNATDYLERAVAVFEQLRLAVPRQKALAALQELHPAFE